MAHFITLAPHCVRCSAGEVSARSRSTAVAGAIAGTVREHRRAKVQVIGAGGPMGRLCAPVFGTRWLGCILDTARKTSYAMGVMSA